MVQFFAQPYDVSATGFYFDDEGSYHNQINRITNRFGQQVEEFEIQFIDGDSLDCELTKAIGIHQANIVAFMAKVDEWEDWEKINLIIAIGECGYSFDIVSGSPDDFDIDIYHVQSMEELAEQFLDDGVFGEIPDQLRCYLDIEAIARDLSFDYTETSIAGQWLVYRCG